MMNTNRASEKEIQRAGASDLEENLWRIGSQQQKGFCISALSMHKRRTWKNLKQELEESQHKQTQKMVELQAKMQSHLHLKWVDTSIHLDAQYTQLNVKEPRSV